jgi:hypothetical protein
MNRRLLLIPASFVGYLLLQALILQHLVLFDTAFCLAYVGFLLFLPFEFSTVLMMLVGFVFGLSLDLFQNSQGLHASACVLLGFVRKPWLDLITPQGGYENAGTVTIRSLGWGWFFSFIIPMLLVHHITLFFTEAAGSGMFWSTVGKALSSVLLTTVFLSTLRLVFSKR